MMPDGAQIHFVEAGVGTDPLRRNIAHHVGDDPKRVKERRLALSRECARPILWMNQTHSTKLARVFLDATGPLCEVGGQTCPIDIDNPLGLIDADGVLVDARQWPQAPGIAVMTADCLPVVLSADNGQIVAAIHAGRRGLLDGILFRALERFNDLHACALHAMIGPTICGRCYEVPESMRARSVRVCPELMSTSSWGTPALDLVAGAIAQLRQGGCDDIELDGRCTREDHHLHSYRRTPSCGRNATVIVPA